MEEARAIIDRITLTYRRLCVRSLSRYRYILFGDRDGEGEISPLMSSRRRL